MSNSTCRTNLIAAVSLAAFLLLWQLISSLVGKEIILPGPLSAFRALFSMAGRGDFWRNLGFTLSRGLAGFMLSYVCGLILGVAAGLNRFFDAAVRPFLAGMRSTPSMAVILLALIWFRSELAAVFVTFLMVFPLVAQNAIEGIRGMDPALLEMAVIYRVGRSRRIRDLYLPAILPQLAAGAVAGLGLTWKVTISAEVLAGPRWGIGTRMDAARVFLNTPEVFAWTIVVILLGLIFDRALDRLVQRRLFSWQ